MVRTKSKLSVICFAVLMFVSLGFVGCGSVIDIVLLYAQLDKVLSPDELQNHEKKTATLTFLQKARGNEGLAWICAGLVVGVLSILGCWSELRHDRIIGPKR